METESLFKEKVNVQSSSFMDQLIVLLDIYLSPTLKYEYWSFGE